MKHPRSSRHLIKMWHRREKWAIDHLVRSVAESKVSSSAHSAFTASGLAIEEQVRKTWRPGGGGLPVF